MTNKLYVANIPTDATEDALRAHFAAIGGVDSVELLHDKHTGRPRGLAHVTMTNDFYTNAALRLDGAAFNGSLLRVSDGPIRGDREVRPDVKIVLQFRERTKMAYDLDCAGVALTLRIGMDDDPTKDTFRVEARFGEGDQAVIGTGVGPTRREALVGALRTWNDAQAAGAGRVVDSEAVARAMLGVKAI